MYQALYDLIANSVYGGAELTSYMELTCTLISTFGVVLLMLIPFIVAWRIIRCII